MAGVKGKISVGLVNVEVRLEKATDDENPDQHTVCTGSEEKPHDPTRVKMAVRCPSCEVEKSSVFGFPQRGREVDGKVVLITKDELDAAAGEPIKTMVPTFHAREKVYAATVAADSVQNVFPDKGSEKAYVALRNALASRPHIVACTVWAPKTKNALWVLEVVGDRIVASKRCWPEDVRAVAAGPQVEVSEIEQDMFGQLVDNLIEDFDVARYVDQRKLGVQALIQERIGNAVTMTDTTTPATVSSGGDMLAALQASIDANAKKAGPRPVKKAAAKKAPAKKAAAKRTTTRKKVA